MKKQLFIFFFLSLVTITNSQIISIPDANFKNALINTNCVDTTGDGSGDSDVDTNNDGEIQVSEAEAIVYLSVSSQDIASLEAIEYFINLTFLRCASNLLSDLDVSALVQLEILKAYGNNIVSINVSGLNQMRQLWLAWNQLETIDISSLQSLEWIYCTDNQLNALDVSGLNNLRSIWASSNQITSIDFTGLDALYYVVLSNNLLSSIDVSPLQNLEILQVNYNLLSEIDVSNMNSLVELYIGDNFLTELDCSTTGAYLIQCENNPNLSSINVQNGVISSSDPDMLWYGFYFYSLPSLEFICMDPGEEQALFHSGYDPETVIVATGPNCTLASEDFTLIEFNVFPNPVKQILFIENNIKAKIRSIKVYDLLGRVVLEENETVDQLDVSQLISGVFIIKIMTDRGVLTEKIIKE